MSKKFVVASAALLIILLAGATIPVSEYTSKHKGFDLCSAGDMKEHSPQVRLDLIKGETLSAIRKADTEPGYIVGCSRPAIYKLYLL